MGANASTRRRNNPRYPLEPSVTTHPDSDPPAPPIPPAAAPHDGSRRHRRQRRRIGAPADGEPTSKRQTLAAGLLAVAVVGSVLAIGAVHLPVLLVTAALAFGAAAVALNRQALGHRGVSVPLPALVCAGLAAYTLLQALPLPIRALEILAPSAADVWERCLLPFGEQGPRWASLSLDPGATMVEALKWTMYGAVFIAAAAVAARHGAAWGVTMVFGAALAAALTTLGHGLAEATTVYGLYQPKMGVVPWHVGPLLNPNNLAGYLNLGALCGLGLMLGERPFLPRWSLGVGVALIVGIEVTAASRGGVVALPIGIVALALFTRRSKARRPVSSRVSTAMIGAAVAGGAVFAFLGGTAKTWAELYDTDVSKLEMAIWVEPLVRDYPFFGVGRGAFESVFAVYRTLPGNMVYTHPENFVVQWIAEWGLPVGLCALGVFAWAFAPRRVGVHDSALAAGAWCGVAVLLLQNLVDLALEVPAVSLGAATVLGSLWGDRRGPGPSKLALRLPGSLTPTRAGLVALPVAVLGLALVMGAVAFGAHDVASDRRSARAALEAAFPPGPGARSQPRIASLRDLLHRVMLRHPAEPYFPLVGATMAFRTRTESPIPWLQRSLERAQINGRAHLLLAEVLAGRGVQRQALLELRLAFEDDPAIVGQAAGLAVRWTRDFDALLLTVPAGERGSRMLASLSNAIGVAHPAREGDAELAARCDQEAILRDPRLMEPRVREAQKRIDALAAGSSSTLCADREACRALILEHADAIAAADPESSTPLFLRGRMLIADGKAEEAARMLEKACERVGDRAPCLQLRAVAASQVKDSAMLDVASKELLGATCSVAADCATMATWLSGVRQSRGEGGLALTLLARAAREEPSNEARWYRLADAASAAGAHAQAAEALEKVARRHGGGDAALRRRIDDEKLQALGGTVPPR